MMGKPCCPFCGSRRTYEVGDRTRCDTCDASAYTHLWGNRAELAFHQMKFERLKHSIRHLTKLADSARD